MQTCKKCNAPVAYGYNNIYCINPKCDMKDLMPYEIDGEREPKIVPPHICKYNLPNRSYGPAIDTTYQIDGKLYVTNGEYTSQVNFCPYCGFEAKEKVKSL